MTVQHALRRVFVSDEEIKSNTQTIPSPCVRNCCLNKEDICVGCFRHIDEIIGWQERTLTEKQLIQKNCQQRRQKNSGHCDN